MRAMGGVLFQAWQAQSIHASKPRLTRVVIYDGYEM